MLYIVCIDVNHNNYAIVPIPDPYGLSPYPATPL